MGTSFGVGVTHLSLMLGTYFSQTRNKIALIEWRNQKAFSAIEEAYEGKESSLDQPFTIKKVVYYKQFNLPNLSTLKDGRYEVLVIDFGEFNENYMSVFTDLDIKILVGHSNEWKYKEIESIYKRMQKHVTQQWKLVLPFATQVEKTLLSHSIASKLFPLGYYKDPFKYELHRVHEIEAILNL
jgi:hypothetical protein